MGRSGVRMRVTAMRMRRRGVLFGVGVAPVLAMVRRLAIVMGSTIVARLIASEGSVPDPVWGVVFICAFLVIGFTFFFGTRNLRAQTLMTGLLAFLIFSELVIVIALDRPFAGGIRSEPRPLLNVLNDFAP